MSSSSKALARLLSRRTLPLDARTGLGSLRRWHNVETRSEGLIQGRCSSSAVARVGSPRIEDFVHSRKEVLVPPVGSLYDSAQKRWFLGCADGEEGGVLWKSYEERRVMGYSPEQLFAVVAAVDIYEDFVP